MRHAAGGGIYVATGNALGLNNSTVASNLATEGVPADSSRRLPRKS
jgi:hypothetical protein